MGLDIYVGSFTRYYCGDWETAAARAAREQGIPFEVIRPNPEPRDKVADPMVVRQAVESWRSALEEGLKQQVAGGLSWDEGVQVEYFTDRPDRAGYAGLVLLAAHTVCPEHPRPEFATTHFDKDAAFQALAAHEFRCRFSQVFEVEIWLPCAFAFTFRAQDVAGREVLFGSASTLLEQLRRLNDESYKADAETLERWQHDGACSEDLFDQTARFGLAMFLRLAQLSVEHRLPMKLDY
jgi:hypothetical protein